MEIKFGERKISNRKHKQQDTANLQEISVVLIKNLKINLQRNSRSTILSFSTKSEREHMEMCFWQGKK